jgi:hypothetical protein
MLVAVRDFDVILDLREFIGDVVERARVTSEPWFVTQALRDRLEGELTNSANDIEIPTSLLGLYEMPSREDRGGGNLADEIFRKAGQRHASPNASQLEAIRYCLGSRLHFVWGPPGTGKTANVAQVVRALVAKGERVLMLAHANAAVDVAILRVADRFTQSQELAEGKILRIGVPQLTEVAARSEILPEEIISRRQPDLAERKAELEAQRHELLERLRHTRPKERSRLASDLDSVRTELAAIREMLKNALDSLIRNALVLGATLSRMAIDDAVWSWPADAILVDETSMASFPWVLAAALRTKKRLLLFGDFRQLPPICLATTPLARRWLAKDAFDISGVRDRIEHGQSHSPVTLLNTQYRMAEPIAALVSRFAYDGRLHSDPSTLESTRRLSATEPWRGAALIIGDTERLLSSCIREPRPGSYSRANPLHALLATSFAEKAVRDGCSNVALISAYRAHARLLAAGSMVLHPHVTGATVHRFQGSERDLVIFDLVDAFPQAGASQLTGRDADTAFRLLNVAVSRARGKLIVLADVKFILERHPRSSPSRSLLRLLKGQGQSEEVDVSLLAAISESDGLRWYQGWEQAETLVSQDLRRARQSAIVNLPEGFNPGVVFVDALINSSAVCPRVTVFGSKDIAVRLETSAIDLRLMIQPGGFFAFVNDRVAWIGSYSPLGAIARVEIPSLVDALGKLLLSSAKLPHPSAEAERAMMKIAGRCPECGEDRHPRHKSRAGWVLGCGNLRHESAPLSAELLTEIAEAFDVRCPECHKRAVGRNSGKHLFFGCPDYSRGCGGKPPSLEELFRGTK